MFICRIGWKVLGIILPLGTLWCYPIQQLGCFFLFPCLGLLLVWPSHLFIPFLFCTLFSVLGLTCCAVFQNTLYRHAGEQLTQIAHYSQPVMHLLEVGGYCLSVSPSLECQGKNYFNPILEEILEHLKALPEYSLWRLIMALFAPLSYSW